ncbi:hypothetical protein K443DRAFT_131120 [Laccaria amethystina LaAM-08-1]|uniref:XPG-I domain-containing protein n=1 Tax=Laccaria amethystina LaAM-08-1 TaxID=1095629 RepID=A0A0C9Y750_9AGAR|nr:hypothetical protein K443DRAFT_131120 [Laccaria amethystina LaAM-08-1]
MGIEDLWKLLEPVAEHISLHQLAVEDGFVNNIGGVRAYQVGIDASGWVYHALYRHSASKNPELATLYVRCCRLLDKPIRPYFVFYGPKRPSVKRGKHVRGNPHWIERDFKKMLVAFGFPSTVALGEADAELAWLSKEGFIDAIASEDSDLIVLGAVVVLRNFLYEDSNEKVTIYCADAIGKHAALGFTDIDFLVIALLLANGLEWCGIRTAVGLARAGLGHRLLHGLSQSQDVDNFMEVWRNELHDELIVSKTNPTDLLGSSPHPILLANFAEENFCWGSSHGILSHFETTIFPALALNDICRIACETDLGLAKRPCQFIGKVLQRWVPLKARDCPHHPEVRLSLIVLNMLVDSIIGSLLGKLNDGETEGKNAARSACMSTGGKAPHASGSMGMPCPLKQKQGRSREDNGTASSSKRPKHHKISSADHFDAIDLTTPEPIFEDVFTNKQQNHHNVIDTIDLTQSDPEPVTGLPERRYHLDVSDDGHLIEFITDSGGEL